MMKNVVTALFTIYSLSSGQQPPVIPPVTPEPVVVPPIPPIPPPEPIIPPQTPQSTQAQTPPITPPITPPVTPPQTPPITPPVTVPAPAPALPVPPLPVPVQPVPPQTAQPPFGQIFGAFNQICGPPQTDNVCKLNTQSASDVLSGTPGFMKCEREFDCCPCQSITCGTLLGTGCNTLSIGASGAFGVKEVSVIGRPQGANIDVLGLEGAMSSIITGSRVIKVASSGEMGLRNANVKVEIIGGFQMQCDAMGSCQGAKLEFVIPGPPEGYACNPAVIFPDLEIAEIRCGGQAACENAEITIRNNGCGRVIINQVQCTQLDSCTNAIFNLIGDVDINTCDLGPSGQTSQGLERCFVNLERLLCPDVNSCIGPKPRILRDPGNDFLWECGGLTSCAGSDLTIEISENPSNGAITRFEGFKFGGVGSGAGAKITINNKQIWGVLTIELIDCPSQNSCAGLTIYTGSNVNIVQFNCAPGACNGCTYQKDEISPVYACDPNSAFNNPIFPPQTPSTPSTPTTPILPPPPQQGPPQQPVVPPGVIPINPFNPAIPNPVVPIPNIPAIPAMPAAPVAPAVPAGP